MNDQITSLIRSILKIGGTWLVAKGFFDAGSIDLIVGSLATIGGVLWSAYSTHKKKA